ncbi:MAG: chemotaxis protein CheB [Desulfobacteraceae bacterium]|nr:chemotaxis protein CheB [Desulfobacteraceae bacterium]
MILFCEECGTRNTINEEALSGDIHRFACNGCHEVLMVSLANRQAQKSAFAALTPQAAGSRVSDVQNPLKVLIVDDSKLIRKALRDIIESDGRKKVIGEAENGQKALDFLISEQPDIITLDINMPVMDGLTTLKHIMISRPIPTVMISALTKEGSAETFDSLKYGAIDFLPKPSQAKGADLNSQKQEILRKIDLVAGVQIESIRYLRRPSKEQSNGRPDALPFNLIFVIGVAEGGYAALLNVIPRLKKDLPATYIAVMHQAPHHIDGFVKYLDQCSYLSVHRAVDGVALQGGTCYLAAASEQVTLAHQGEQIILKVTSTSISGQSINQLMASTAELMKERAAGVILTGAGDDGVDGLGTIMEKGGKIFVQDPRSCLFKETPMKAAAKYTLDYLVSDKQMAGAINSFIKAHSN